MDVRKSVSGTPQTEAEPPPYRERRLTSATAVHFFSQSVCASCSSVLPAAARCLRSHRSPTCAWLPGPTVFSLSAPSECLEVTTSLVGVSAAMKMMQPLDLSVRVYGAAVCDSRDPHYERRVSPLST